MAAVPNYEGTKRSGSVILNNGSGTTLSAAVLTGVAAGTRVREVRLNTGPTTAPGSGVKVAVILADGTNDTVIDLVTLSNTADAVQAVLRYDNVFLVGTGCSIKFQMRTALASGATLHCEVFGADF
jgi:hypothetical protein